MVLVLVGSLIALQKHAKTKQENVS